MKKILIKKVEIQLAPAQAWGCAPFTPELIINCKEFLPGDIIHDFIIREKHEVPFMSSDGEEVTYKWPAIVVERKVEETDEEYFNRLKNDEAIKKATEAKEKLEYIRLKAKYGEQN